MENNKTTAYIYQKNIQKIKNNSKVKNRVIGYEEAENIVYKYITDKKKQEFSLDSDAALKKIKTKAEMREYKKQINQLVSECVLNEGFYVQGYTGRKGETKDFTDFINEMVSEIGGYSVLEDAINDESVDDIYCLAWNKIYVERNGVNVKYEKTFKNVTHFNQFIERFLRRAGCEINMGQNKIVDFELYGDRGCATSPAVTPDGFTLTLRKHKEDHIQVDQLLAGGVISEEIRDFMSIIIDGEANLIYAGITGTGKTTTIRAVLDDVVTKNGKRMLVCEDTQELFPKNDHTMQMVSSPSDDPKANVTLYNLIITALRLKPKYIVVGEVRAAEAQAAVEGMETGHSTIFTMHAKEPINALNRLVTKYLQAMPSLSMEVVERIVGSAIDFIMVQDAIPGMGRKVYKITQVRFDDVKKGVVLEDLCVYNFETETWQWLRRPSKDKATHWMRRGVDKERARLWTCSDNPEEEKAWADKMNENSKEREAGQKEHWKKVVEERLAKAHNNSENVVNTSAIDERQVSDVLKQIAIEEEESIQRKIEINKSMS